jgi:purine-cytosine permease-like protein
MYYNMNDQTFVFTKQDEEALPVPEHKLHGWKHFAGIYASEHVAATEFVIGATFVAMGASTKNILLGLLIGNLLAILSWTFITTPIAVRTRMSLYWYLNKIAGNPATRLYNWANVLIFTVISAAMITVSASAVRFMFNIPAQLNWFPTDLRFVLVVIAVGMAVVVVATYGFNVLAEFSAICGPWLFVMFVGGFMAILPALADHVLGKTSLSGWSDFVTIADRSIWTGTNAAGDKGVGFWEVMGFAWAANTITHVGLIDMAIFRFAKKWYYGLCSGFGMLFGHYIAWIAAGIMGAGTAVILKSSIVELDPGDVAFYALGISGFVTVIIAGWTTANTNLYRAGLAAQAVFSKHSRSRVTFIVGLVTVIAACSPFVFKKFLPLLTYCGLIVVPVGAIVFTEHYIFRLIGLTRYWVHYKNPAKSFPAVIAWIGGLVFGFGLNILDIMPFYYLFIPTWFFTSILYIFLASRSGARDKYPEAEALEAKRDSAIIKYQKEQAIDEKVTSSGPTFITRITDAISWISLAVILIFAAIAMFGSPDISIYKANKALFDNVAIICTVIYFVFGYWTFRMRKAVKHK